ncbi:GntR family transcriptional regulator [endosymbiont 'TC1' of Trimyema compressum]|uniref:GntR family transcriptional regulator n=1 Tax=endosymbiont 'TC1' of Trimyema compressum TaxID=243899 RepID=UPI0007F05FBA|nr:GntR family transcriptional regulator [endosymbiont 'TC1' of Trimyema compressum]AMP19896.1 GntR family transcriptional regulator [endosymbiont 'TC1' of Trimyema compressum]
MNIIISHSSDKPIYEQIITQLKQKIITGELKEGDELPSLRFLAKELRISVITTKRAYEELAHEEFIISRPGKGYYIGEKNMEKVKEVQLDTIKIHLEKAIQLGTTSGLSLKDLYQVMTALYEKKINEK